MAANDEDGNGNVNDDGNQAESSEMDQYMEEIFSQPLLSQDPPVHEVESNQDDKKETTGTSDSCALGVYRSIWNDQETSNEQGTSTNQLLPDSSTNVHVTSGEASSSDVTNVETKSVPVTSGEDEMVSPSQVTNAIDQQKKLLSMEKDDAEELSKLGFSFSDDLEPEQCITTTASSPGRLPLVPMTKALVTSTHFVPRTPRNQPAMNLPHTQRYPQAMNLPQIQWNPQAMNPQWQVPPGQYGGRNMAYYGNVMTSPSWRPGQIYMVPPYLPPSAPPSPFLQHGGSNMAHYGTMVTSPSWRPEQNDIYYNMPPQLDPSMVPYGYGPHGSAAYPFDPSANSSFGYEGVPGNYVSSIQYQSGDQNVYPPSYEGVPGNYLPSIQQYQSGDSFVYPTSYEGVPGNYLPSIQQYQSGDQTVYPPSYEGVPGNYFPSIQQYQSGDQTVYPPSYEGVPGNYLPSIRQPQGGGSVVYPPSSRRSRQQRQRQQRRSGDFATQNQRNDRSDDPSDQTQRDN